MDGSLSRLIDSSIQTLPENTFEVLVNLETL